VSREENLAMVRDSVAYLVNAGKRVIYDAEHFFDGYRDDAVRARVPAGAADAGAENVTLCDTNGSSLPAQVAEATGCRRAARRPGRNPHPQRPGVRRGELAGAVEQGASLVQGTMQRDRRSAPATPTSPRSCLRSSSSWATSCVSPEQLARLTGIAHFIDELLNITPDPDQPFVGRNAFAHKGGMHVAGVSATPAPSSTWIRTWSATSAIWWSPSSPARERSWARRALRDSPG
jgi:2-isopropylmalate synthase